MRKISLLIFSIILFIPFVVNAKVLSLDTTVDGNTISFNGTTEDDTTAVMCKLFDSSDNELDKLSVAVDNNSFEGSFTNVNNAGDYTIGCAKYEGGEIQYADATVETDTIMYTFEIDPNGGTILDNDLPTSVPAGTELTLEKLTADQVKAPDGKELDAYEINGKRYEINSKYTVNSNTVVKLLWKDIKSSKNSDNPKTFDAGITASIIALAIAVSGVVGTTVYLKKKNK